MSRQSASTRAYTAAGGEQASAHLAIRCVWPSQVSCECFILKSFSSDVSEHFTTLKPMCSNMAPPCSHLSCHTFIPSSCALQIAAFFASDGAAVTNPGSLLHLSIYPGYYNGVSRVCLLTLHVFGNYTAGTQCLLSRALPTLQVPVCACGLHGTASSKLVLTTLGVVRSWQRAAARAWFRGCRPWCCQTRRQPAPAAGWRPGGCRQVTAGSRRQGVRDHASPHTAHTPHVQF